MEIKNMKHFKELAKPGAVMVVLAHRRKDLVGTERKIQKLRTNYIEVSVDGVNGIMDIPMSRNCEFGKTMKVYDKPPHEKNSNLILEIEIKER